MRIKNRDRGVLRSCSSFLRVLLLLLLLIYLLSKLTLEHISVLSICSSRFWFWVIWRAARWRVHQCCSSPAYLSTGSSVSMVHCSAIIRYLDRHILGRCRHVFYSFDWDDPSFVLRGLVPQHRCKILETLDRQGESVIHIVRTFVWFSDSVQFWGVLVRSLFKLTWS